jgi:hypothetical protein
VIRSRTDTIVYLVLATITFAVVASAAPGQRAVALHVYVLAVGAIVLTGLGAGIGDAVLPRGRSELIRALNAKPLPPERTPELARMERAVTLGVANAWDLHSRLLPQLREIAQARLERAGKQPGPDTLERWWELLRPDRPEPTERFAPGISESELRALVADLQRM